MSDLLLMASSPLRSLLSTPGLVACYLPGMQVLQGLTGQSLLDYSGKGNHAQLGSTAGVDANDPTWGTNALIHGADDYANCVLGWDVNSVADHLVVFSSNTTSDSVTQRFWFIHRAWNRYYAFNIYKSDSTLAFRVNVNDATNGATVGDAISLTLGSVYAYLLRRTATKAQIIDPRSCSVVSEAVMADHEAGGNYFSTNGERGASFKVADLNIYAGMTCLINMSDAEITQKYNALKTLLAGQGVTVA